ncbi:MAG: PHP domain-containing protein [Clostridia bacterium]|nr:PHP domain-containing protein [Clostridia bacterium]
MYKFEIHLHTNNCSACAKSSPREYIDAALEHEYSGIVVTNHFYHGNTRVDRNLPWRDFVNAYIEDYLEFKELGDKYGITVFFGIEEGFAAGKEMLVYGLDPQCLLDHPEFLLMTLKEKYEFIHECGGICVCAHPFRDRSYIPDPNTPPNPKCFDAIECFNLSNTIEANEKAFVYSFNNKKVMLSGSDVHHAKAFGNAGIAFDTPVTDYPTFLEKVKKGDFKLIYPEF